MMYPNHILRASLAALVSVLLFSVPVQGQQQKKKTKTLPMGE